MCWASLAALAAYQKPGGAAVYPAICHRRTASQTGNRLAFQKNAKNCRPGAPRTTPSPVQLEPDRPVTLMGPRRARPLALGLQPRERCGHNRKAEPGAGGNGDEDRGGGENRDGEELGGADGNDGFLPQFAASPAPEL